MMLNLVKGNNADESAADENGIAPSGHVIHGTKAIKELVETQSVKGDREVAVYSYFYSEKYENALDYMDLGFIGVSKQASQQYPMSHLQRKDFTRGGD